MALSFVCKSHKKKIHPYSPFFSSSFPNIKKTSIKVKTIFFLRVNFMNRGLYFSQPSLIKVRVRFRATDCIHRSLESGECQNSLFVGIISYYSLEREPEAPV